MREILRAAACLVKAPFCAAFIIWLMNVDNNSCADFEFLSVIAFNKVFSPVRTDERLAVLTLFLRTD